MQEVVDQLETNIIYAAHYMPKNHLPSANDDHGDFSDDREGVLLRIFGDIPDYSDERMEALWEKVLSHEPEYIYEYCFLRGIDVFMADGSPVPPWRDIAVMLMALEKGYLEFA